MRDSRSSAASKRAGQSGRRSRRSNQEKWGPDVDLRKGISEELWGIALRKAERFAKKDIHWHIDHGGSEDVLPDGYDVSSIAAEAVAGLLQKIARRPSSAPPSLQELLQDLQKRVRRLVNRLYHRKEMEILHIEADLDPIITDDGENLSVLEAAPAPGLDPSEELIQKEEQGEFEQLKEQFHRFLGQDQLLQDLFGCLCAGILKRAAIARKLGLTPKLVTYAQKRLARRAAEFNRQRNLKKSSRPAENSHSSTTYIVEGDRSLGPDDPKAGQANMDQAA